ncbi:hypothetical protein AOLI_G00244370 [Acnodon oligacanthus]
MADLFMQGSKTYLLVVDYYSRYVEIAHLTTSRCNNVILHLKSIFAHHGVPETLVIDNGQAFAPFVESYGFCHTTSILRFPQSNGEAERSVKTVKSLLRKAVDPYLSLLAYRATPLHNGYSPAQLLMGRRLRTTLPMLPALLNPALPDAKIIARKENERRILESFQSLSVSSGSEDSSSISDHHHLSFEGVRSSLSDLKERLEEFCREEFRKIPPRAAAAPTFLSEPKSREDFLQCKLSL